MSSLTIIHLVHKYWQTRSMKSVNFFYNFSYRIKFHYILDTTINYDQILYQFSWYMQVQKSDNQISGSSVGGAAVSYQCLSDEGVNILLANTCTCGGG